MKGLLEAPGEMGATEDKDRLGNGGESLLDPGSSVLTERDSFHPLEVMVIVEVSPFLEVGGVSCPWGNGAPVSSPPQD